MGGTEAAAGACLRPTTTHHHRHHAPPPPRRPPPHRLPPLLRQRTSAYREARDADAGSSLPKDSKHPVFSVVRKTQAELIDAEKSLEKLERMMLDVFP